jgi:hypothetical protein
VPLTSYPNRSLSPSYNANTIAELGTLRKIVIPQPAYNPRRPCARQIAPAVPKYDGRGAPGRSSSAVCTVLLTVSAGKSARLYAAPAHAPANALSHVSGGGGGAAGSVGSGPAPPLVRAARRDASEVATASFVVNHAAEPPVSRMSVPVCPSQSPRSPCWRTMLPIRANGPGGFVPAARGASICTCILHLISSTGVLRSGVSGAYHTGRADEDGNAEVRQPTRSTWEQAARGQCMHVQNEARERAGASRGERELSQRERRPGRRAAGARDDPLELAVCKEEACGLEHRTEKRCGQALRRASACSDSEEAAAKPAQAAGR